MDERQELLAKWRAAFSSEPPSHIQNAFMRRALAWHNQMQADRQWRGDAGQARLERLLKPYANVEATNENLNSPTDASSQLSNEVTERDTEPSSQKKNKSKAARRLPLKTTQLSIGARLVRHWQGKTYHVNVVKDGFEYAGQIFKSLSSVAKHITGTPWSGPVFFGIKANSSKSTTKNEGLNA